MLNPNVVLMENTLKSSFMLVLTVINHLGEEKEQIFKKSRRSFLKETNIENYHVKLVNDYPDTKSMELGIFYVSKNGKTVWLRIKESDFGKEFC